MADPIRQHQQLARTGKPIAASTFGIAKDLDSNPGTKHGGGNDGAVLSDSARTPSLKIGGGMRMTAQTDHGKF